MYRYFFGWCSLEVAQLVPHPYSEGDLLISLIDCMSLLIFRFCILKRNLQNFAKSFMKKILTLSCYLIHSKLKIIFRYKDPIPNDLKSCLLYKFTWASCSSSFISKTCRHFKTSIQEHIKEDSKSIDCQKLVTLKKYFLLHTTGCCHHLLFIPVSMDCVTYK